MPYREMRDAPADEAAKGSSPAEPMLRIAFDETEAIPGQQLSLRLTVLVPTYMPEPPVWPSLEAPNLLVRLPEGSTTPTSERVGGATWSGITRHYRLSPMVPGDFEIPPQQVTVTFVDPETLETARATLSTEALAYSAVVPEGANGLDPLLAAETLEIAQEVEGDPQAMAPGDSVTRTVTARIEGTSPIFLPTLLPAVVIEGVAAYPDEPVLSESDDRGVVSGIRTESVVYVAEGGGSGVAPPVSIAWYVLGTGKIERASLEGFPISIDGPPAWSGEPGDWRVLGIAAVAGLLFLGLGWWLLRRLFPLARRWMRRRRAARLDSENSCVPHPEQRHRTKRPFAPSCRARRLVRQSHRHRSAAATRSAICARRLGSLPLRAGARRQCGRMARIAFGPRACAANSSTEPEHPRRPAASQPRRASGPTVHTRVIQKTRLLRLVVPPSVCREDDRLGGPAHAGSKACTICMPSPPRFR